MNEVLIYEFFLFLGTSDSSQDILEDCLECVIILTLAGLVKEEEESIIIYIEMKKVQV